MSSFSVGVDLGGTMIKAALVERGEGFIELLSVDTDAEDGAAAVIDRIAGLIERLIDKTPKKEIAGIGIGAPGAVDWDRDSVIHPPNLPGWGIVNLREELQARLGDHLPVFVENDANVAGLGSAHYGAGVPHPSFIMVTLGTGVGGAIIHNNKIFRGSTGGAGEIGHMTINYEGPMDRSGVPGSIEAYLGQRFLSRYAKYRIRNEPDSKVHELVAKNENGMTPRVLYDAAVAGDAYAIEVLAWAGHKLGCILGSCVNLLDIRKVIVGGGVSAAGKYILEPARESMKRFVYPGLRDGIEIIRETLGNEVGMLGAAYLVFEYLDEHSFSS